MIDGVRLRAMRGTQSIPDVARLVGCSVASLSVWETEGACPSTESVEALRRFYGDALTSTGALVVTSMIEQENQHMNQRYQERMDDKDAQ